MLWKPKSTKLFKSWNNTAAIKFVLKAGRNEERKEKAIFLSLSNFAFNICFVQKQVAGSWDLFLTKKTQKT